REVMYRLEGGCKVPLAAFAEMRKGTLLVRALVASLDGDRIVEGAEEGPPEDAVRLGGILADRLLESGAAEILEEIQRV
ncbi:MAG: hydroxymethylbilane synthase, partial [bacterium]|nr:hydroxymethylbilane synthase [bacterium]